MKQFFDFDRRKKDNVVEQLVHQFITYVHDYKLIHGSPIPDMKLAKKELNLSEDELNQILIILQAKGYVKFDKPTQQYLVQLPNQPYDFLINVAPAYQEIIRSGKKPAVFTLEKSQKTVDGSMIKQFPGLILGQSVTHYKRYLTADDVPMFYMEFCLVDKHLPRASTFFKDNQPHLTIMVQHFTHQYQFHIREIRIVIAPPHVQKILNPNEKDLLCTLGFYQFFNSRGETVESGFAYMTELTEFTTSTTDLNALML